MDKITPQDLAILAMLAKNRTREDRHVLMQRLTTDARRVAQVIVNENATDTDADIVATAQAILRWANTTPQPVAARSASNMISFVRSLAVSE